MAARAARSGRRTHTWWLRHGPTYAGGSPEMKVEALEHPEEARRWAVEGVEEYLIYAGGGGLPKGPLLRPRRPRTSLFTERPPLCQSG